MTEPRITTFAALTESPDRDIMPAMTKIPATRSRPKQDNTAITIEKMDELLRFLPLLEVPDREYVRAWGGGETTPDGKAIQVPYPIYCDDVFEFYMLAGQAHWADYQYNPRQAHDMLSDDEFIATASLDELKTMLTYCVRGERFGDGHWAQMLESGRIVALLRRLAALRDELNRTGRSG